MKKLLIYLVLIAMMAGCAGKYVPIRPEGLPYTNISNGNEKITVAYQHDILRYRGNKKYTRKADKKGIKIVALKLTNHSSRPLVVGKDIVILSGNSPANLLNPIETYQKLKQTAPLYLLYLLLTPVNLFITDSEGETDAIPVGLVLGPGIALGNTLGSSTANNNFRQELLSQSLNGKTIMPGETVTGLVSFFDSSFNAISVDVKESN